MMLLRSVVGLAVPASVALIAFLQARAIGALVDAAATPPSIAPFAEARAAAAATSASSTRSAETILAHNPFDHTARASASVDDAPAEVPPCEGVHATVSVSTEDADASFALLRVGADGRRLLRSTGGEVDDERRVVAVGADRVWLERGGKLCVARVFGGPAVTATTAAPVQQSAIEKEIVSHIARTGANEVQIDRGAVDRILEAPAELMKAPLVAEKEGERVVGYRLLRVRPGSVLAALGIESGDRLVSINGIEVGSTERMLEGYARLRTGTIDRLTIHLVRNGKPLNVDYVVR